MTLPIPKQLLFLLVVIATVGAGSAWTGMAAEGGTTRIVMKNGLFAFQRANEIYVAGADGRGTRLISGKILDPAGSPAWSPDGRRIVVSVSGRNDRSTLELIDARGKSLRSSLPFDYGPIDPAFSPDGNSIALSNFQPTDSGQITYAIEVGQMVGGSARHLTGQSPDRADEWPTWSADSNWICFQRTPYSDKGPLTPFLMIVSAAGGPARRVTTGGEPDWSPDGKLIMFADHGDIYVVRPDGAGRRKIIGDKKLEGSPRWSPDGKKLAFIRPYGRKFLFTRQRSLWVATADGRNQKRIIAKVLAFDWQPVP